MSTAETPAQPTLNDVLAELRLQRMENRTAFSEIKADISSLRLETNTRLLEINVRLDEVRTRLNTLFDELATFRADYNGHTHNGEA